MKAVLRAAFVVRLKIAAAVLLATVVAAAAVGAGMRGGAGARELTSDQDTGRAPAVASHAATDPSAGHRPADEIVKEIEAALAMDAQLGGGNQDEVRLMPKVNDLSALPTAGKHLIIVADVNHALYLRMFDVEGKMVLDSDAKRLTNTWADYLQQLVPKCWPPHELTNIERISIINAVTEIAHCTYWDELRRVHGRIASLVGELRAVYPHDPRVAHYLPERWASLIRPLIGQRGVVDSEVREILETTRDPELRTSALYFQTSLRFQDPIDGRVAVSLAESFARQAPGDKRAGEMLFMAAHRLAFDWATRVRLALVFAVVAGLLAATIGMRRWLKYVVRVGIVLFALFAVALAVLFFVANDTLIATIRFVYDGSAVATVLSRLLTILGFLPESPSEADRPARTPFLVSWLGPGTLHQLRVLAGTIWAAIAVTLAALCGVFLVVARRRFAEPPTRWPSAIRLGILTFFAVLAASCAVDACLLGLQRKAIREHIRRDYPNAFPGKLIQRERSQHEPIGEPFELEVLTWSSSPAGVSWCDRILRPTA